MGNYSANTKTEIYEETLYLLCVVFVKEFLFIANNSFNTTLNFADK
jgi:hypothetical protein